MLGDNTGIPTKENTSDDIVRRDTSMHGDNVVESLGGGRRSRADYLPNVAAMCAMTVAMTIMGCM
jgi:hypothetical protein